MTDNYRVSSMHRVEGSEQGCADNSRCKSTMDVTVVGVVGAGVMGRGVALALVLGGYSVILCDVVEQVLDSAIVAIRANLRARILMGTAVLDESPDRTMSRIMTSVNLQLLAGADFVIENATENIETKRAIFGALDGICAADVIFAVNTSTFPVDEVASLTRRPENVIGTHFMNPADLKKTVELVAGARTSARAVDVTMALLQRMGKKVVAVNDGPGFVSNRLLMAIINDAVRLVQTSVASAENVDKVFVDCFGHAMGPLATADLIGLDTVLLSMQSLCVRLDKTRYEPCRMLRDLVAAGRLGRKTGRGFYEY